MKKKNIVSSIAAFLSVAAMFIPMAEEGEFGDYDHMVGGILYVFRRAGSGFYSSEPIWKIFAVLQVVAICMLLIWGISSLAYLYIDILGAVEVGEGPVQYLYDLVDTHLGRHVLTVGRAEGQADHLLDVAHTFKLATNLQVSCKFYLQVSQSSVKL